MSDPNPHSECSRAMEWRDREIHALRSNTRLLGDVITRMGTENRELRAQVSELERQKGTTP